MMRSLVGLAAVVSVLVSAGPAFGQDPGIDSVNPLEIIDSATSSVPGFDGGLSGSLNVLLLLTVLTLAPSILILCTCFTRIMIVLALLRQAIGTQGLPPGQVLAGLSLLLTFVVMAPTFERIYENAIEPYASGATTDVAETWAQTRTPLREFMFEQIDATGNWSSVYLILNYRGVDTSDPGALRYEDVDMLTLVPAYVLSELKVAFLMGFRVYLPFLVIDMVIASLLISMGMLMLPPVLISLPFKLLLFVLVDGWSLVVESLLLSFREPTTDLAQAGVSALPAFGFG
ncbi:MAG: flagellar type III secretion system pore protein FliP [Phycisphaerales bacterium]|nr:flagellar type III secretion system pore protein FliP [Phycisphaerales bacterium]